MKFGFISTPESAELRRYVAMLNTCAEQTSASGVSAPEMINHGKNLIQFMQFPPVTSAAGATCHGVVTYLPVSERQTPVDYQATLSAGCETLRESGVDVIGIGGTDNRMLVADSSGDIITFGDRMMFYAAYKNILQLTEWLEVSPAAETVAITGLCAEMSVILCDLLAAQRFNILLHEPKIERHEGLIQRLSVHGRQVKLTSGLEDCYACARMMIVGSDDGRQGMKIDIASLRPGSICLYLAPGEKEQISEQGILKDRLVLDSSQICISEEVKIANQPLNSLTRQPFKDVMAETMILAFGKSQGVEIGSDLSDDQTILAFGRLAEQHGFYIQPTLPSGEKIDKLDVLRLKCYYRLDRQDVEMKTLDYVDRVIWEQPSREKTLLRHHRHINPVMVDFLSGQHCDNVFLQGNGVHLTDHHGRRYLDMVAGYGCISLGHNPQPVIQAVTDYLADGGPNFVQYISIAERPTKLAEVLTHIAPGHLERVFFSNSGTEAVEAAIKVAKAATGNPSIAYLKNSYHGKTMGSLSVTGREKHRTHFQPLLAHTIEVPFGDLDALATTLRTQDVGAFILEPIQGEGGVRVPPEGYLKGVQALCRETDTLLMVDEIQTGFGRTGRLFACNWEDVKPDVLILSKALSGGVMPIGATLCTREVWDRAYGSLERFLHHTSTFGGGNLASVAGLAAIRQVLAQELPQHTDELGTYFKQQLQQVAKAYPFIAEVRGKGLLLGIEFNQDTPLPEHLFSQTCARVVQELGEAIHLFPEDVRQQFQAIDPRQAFSAGEILCLSFVTRMCVDHRILTFFTANSYTVVRVQPPLIVSQKEVDQFVDAFRMVCEDLSEIFNNG
jgi:acetylornithine/succinyldiaminopimelate/putrescine aminotransferase/predicted amino acid dehydrogenase